MAKRRLAAVAEIVAEQMHRDVEILLLHRKGWTVSQIAEKFGLDWGVVKRAILKMDRV